MRLKITSCGQVVTQGTTEGGNTFIISLYFLWDLCCIGAQFDFGFGMLLVLGFTFQVACPLLLIAPQFLSYIHEKWNSEWAFSKYEHILYCITISTFVLHSNFQYTYLLCIIYHL